MPRIAQIVSTARYLPKREVPNAELAARFAALGRPHVIDKLATSTGINRRFYAPENWVTSDLALAAAKEALKRAGRKPEDVDLVMIGATSPDYVAPNTAVVVQNKVGAKNAGTFDVDCACAAFPAQVAIAAGLLATNTAMKTILLVSVDMIHRLSDPTDPGVFLWGDGDGAAVMEAGDREGFIGGRPFRPTARTRSAGASLQAAPSSRRTSMPSRRAAPGCGAKPATIRLRSTKTIGRACSSACQPNADSRPSKLTS